MIKDILVLEFYFYNWRGTSLLSEVRHILVSEVGFFLSNGYRLSRGGICPSQRRAPVRYTKLSQQKNA